MTESGELEQRLQAALGDGYAVERRLGEGGFAVVFLVRDIALKRKLAVKVLSPDLITSKTVLDRFRREAETVAQLAHPNIVPLHFIGERDGLLYLAMQCIEGGSIADRIRREGPLPVADATRVMAEVASALAYAHKRGVIHRDIKPANVLIDPDTNRCLVTDFGIARTAEGGALTATGMMLGTAAYLAPEQVTGDGLDHRIDLFALGVTAYEMLAGKVPYEGPTPTAAMMKRLAGPPEPITSVRRDVPRDVAALITACLVADPAERVQRADDVVAALGGDSAAMLNVTRSHAARSRPRRVWPLIATVVVALVVVTAWLAGRRGRGTPMPPAMLTIPAGTFPVGSDRGPSSARPRHTVQVAAFEIERTEVTVGAYAAYVRTGRAPTPWAGAPPDSSLPVTGVPYIAAQQYCGWKYADGGRLPTELEWEAAARGASGREYPYGAVVAMGAANTASAQRTGPAPVGSFPRGATPDGLEDMSGNVWEWTSSPRAAYPGGAALEAVPDQQVVIRGGAFNTPDSLATTWMRAFYPVDTPASRLPNTGFRCVRSK